MIIIVFLSALPQTAAMLVPTSPFIRVKQAHYLHHRYYPTKRHYFQQQRAQRFSSISLPAGSSSLENDPDIAAFIEAKERRDTLLSTTVFEKADGVIVDAIAQSMEKVSVSNNEQLFQQGEASDGNMYIVASGTFDCIDEETGEVKKVVKTSDLFGEIAPEFGNERALTVKASSEDATVWKIPYREFIDGIKSKTDIFDKSLVQAIEQNPEYASYFEMNDRTRMFRKCAFFKPLQPRDFNEVVRSASLRLLGQGETLFKEGEQGDTMYVVKEGSIDIISETSRRVLKTCTRGDSFGELAIFFSMSNQRKASALATEGSQVWEVQKDIFFEAVQESDLANAALKTYRDAYKDKQFGFGECLEYLKLKSRPKKKPVSFHSTFSVFSTGVACASLGQLFSPGLGRCGFQIFDVYQNINESTTSLLQVSAWMIAASGVMGILRLPPNSPQNREVIFKISMWLSIFIATLLSSNVNANPTAWFIDAFAYPGKFVVLVPFIMTVVELLRMIDDAIAGPNVGRESNTLTTNRALAFGVPLLILVMLYALASINVIYILSSNFETYTDELAEVLSQASMNGIIPIVQFTITMISSLGALLLTLQFEKKINPTTGAVLAVISLVLLNYDGAIAPIANVPAILEQTGPLGGEETPEKILPLFLFEHNRTFFFVYWGSTLAVILSALWKRVKADKD